MVETTREMRSKVNIPDTAVGGLSFCSQMQALVLVDNAGKALRPAMIYMDQRSGKDLRKWLKHGLTLAGMNASLLLSSLRITGGVSASVKDQLWKDKWVERNEPEIFERIYKWLDVKEYVASRCTGEFLMTENSANATFLFDTRPGKLKWSDFLMRQFGVRREHLPPVIRSADTAGRLRRQAATELGLPEGLSVYGGGGDLTMTALGSGGVAPGDTHVYVGTSSWVSQVTDRRKVDLAAFMASIIGAPEGLYNFIGESETAGKCLEWVRDHLALDEIGVYLKKQAVNEEPESRYGSLLEYLDAVIEKTPAGAGGVFFTPWLHGSRSPFEDPAARGMFFGISLSTGKRDLIRAVVEGIVYQAAWQLSIVEKNLRSTERIRFVGGGALSRSAARILADVTGKAVEVIQYPQNAEALGAAMVCAVGSGLLGGYPDITGFISLHETYEPELSAGSLYAEGLSIFKEFYRANRKLFSAGAAPVNR